MLLQTGGEDIVLLDGKNWSSIQNLEGTKYLKVQKVVSGKTAFVKRKDIVHIKSSSTDDSKKKKNIRQIKSNSSKMVVKEDSKTNQTKATTGFHTALSEEEEEEEEKEEGKRITTTTTTATTENMNKETYWVYDSVLGLITSELNNVWNSFSAGVTGATSASLEPGNDTTKKEESHTHTTDMHVHNTDIASMKSKSQKTDPGKLHDADNTTSFNDIETRIGEEQPPLSSRNQKIHPPIRKGYIFSHVSFNDYVEAKLFTRMIGGSQGIPTEGGYPLGLGVPTGEIVKEYLHDDFERLLHNIQKQQASPKAQRKKHHNKNKTHHEKHHHNGSHRNSGGYNQNKKSQQKHSNHRHSSKSRKKQHNVGKVEEDDVVDTHHYIHHIPETKRRALLGSHSSESHSSESHSSESHSSESQSSGSQSSGSHSSESHSSESYSQFPTTTGTNTTKSVKTTLITSLTDNEILKTNNDVKEIRQSREDNTGCTCLDRARIDFEHKTSKQLRKLIAEYEGKQRDQERKQASEETNKCTGSTSCVTTTSSSGTTCTRECKGAKNHRTCSTASKPSNTSSSTTITISPSTSHLRKMSKTQLINRLLELLKSTTTLTAGDDQGGGFFCGKGSTHCDCTSMGVCCDTLTCGCTAKTCSNPYGVRNRCVEASKDHVKSILTSLKNSNRFFIETSSSCKYN
eukprot:g3186.t1